MPRVSVVMTVYNGERFLREAVDSILNQTYADFELIVIDDGSTDATPDILESYDDPRLRVVTQQRTGRVKSLNRGVGMARGEYVAIMDADDVSMPERLKEQVRWLDAHPRTSVVGTGTLIVDENGRTARRYPQPIGAVAIRRALLTGRMSPPHPSAMFRKACFEIVGGYREWFNQAMDYDLWLRMVERYDIDCLQEVLLHLRQNLEGITHRQYLQQRRNAAYALQCSERRRKGLPEPSTPPLQQPPTRAELGEYHTLLGRAFLDLNRLDDARTEFRRAVRDAPLSPYTWFFYIGSLVGKSFIVKAFPLAHGILRVLPWLRQDPLGPFRR